MTPTTAQERALAWTAALNVAVNVGGARTRTTQTTKAVEWLVDQYGAGAGAVLASLTAAVGTKGFDQIVAARQYLATLTGEPIPLAFATTLYFTDNGAVACGAHLGAAATYTLHDLSGQPIVPVTFADQSNAKRVLGRAFACETCQAMAKARS